MSRPFGKIGIEGSATTRSPTPFITVKETTPQEVNSVDITFALPERDRDAAVFAPNLSVLDLSDVSVLSIVPSIVGTLD